MRRMGLGVWFVYCLAAVHRYVQGAGYLPVRTFPSSLSWPPLDARNSPIRTHRVRTCIIGHHIVVRHLALLKACSCPMRSPRPTFRPTITFTTLPRDYWYFVPLQVQLAIPHAPATALFHDLRALHGLAKELGPGDATGETALYTANKVGGWGQGGKERGQCWS